MISISLERTVLCVPHLPKVPQTSHFVRGFHITTCDLRSSGKVGVWHIQTARDRLTRHAEEVTVFE